MSEKYSVVILFFLIAPSLNLTTVLAQLTIKPDTLPNAAVGQFYNVQLCTEPKRAVDFWEVSSGSLPPGLTLSKQDTYNAVISGTPFSIGTYQFTVKATIIVFTQPQPIIIYKDYMINVRARAPDLVVTDIICDRNNSLIGYVLKNIGDEVANGNHSTTLYVDGKEVAHDPVGVDLKPGDVFKSWFRNYEWPECRNITVKVCADNFNQVKESDEGNNCLEKTCISYPVPIIIVSGPRAVNVTHDSIIVKWITNKNSDSTVAYSDRSTGEEKTVYDPNLVKDHVIRITGLKPRTTYRFYVKSKDQCGNSVVSKTMVFETTSPPDTENPSVTLFLPERLVGVVNILANASDNVGVGGVMFSIDGVVKFIDFSPPYVWVCNTTLFLNGAHSFDAIAFDAAGNRAVDIKNGTIANPLIPRELWTPPIVQIIKPSRDGWVYGFVQIEASIRAMPLACIRKIELYIDGVLVERQVYPYVYYNIIEDKWVVVPAANSLTFTHLWDASGLEPDSEHVIEVRAWDDTGSTRYGYDRISVKILSIMLPPPVPRITGIEVTRKIVRRENWFDVNVTIRNMGGMPISDFRIQEFCYNLQVMNYSRLGVAEFLNSFKGCNVVIFPRVRILHPGEKYEFYYQVVPILTLCGAPRNVLDFDYSINGHVEYRCEENWYLKPIPIVWLHREDTDGNGIDDMTDALTSANCLIITDVDRLFRLNAGDEEGVNMLLEEAAMLAKSKHGVLAYLFDWAWDFSAETLRMLISRSGAFGGRLGPGFNRILIIGGTEIIPMGRRPTPYGYIFTDDYYADVDDDGRLDFIVHRITGTNARDLLRELVAWRERDP